jgi:hypothetical protein
MVCYLFNLHSPVDLPVDGEPVSAYDMWDMFLPEIVWEIERPKILHLIATRREKAHSTHCRHRQQH